MVKARPVNSSTALTVVSPAGSVGTVNVYAVIGAAKSRRNAPADTFTYS